MDTSNEKNKLLLAIIAVGIIVGMVGFGYQMFEYNNRAVESSSNVDFPDDEPSSGPWIKNTGSNLCPILLEQRFDANESHYRCL